VLEIMPNPELDFDPFERYGGVGPKFDLSDGYLVVMQHPVTTQHEQARADVLETLQAIKRLDLPTLWFWPNVDAGADGTSSGIRTFREQCRPSNMHFFKNMPPTDFLRLLYNSRCLIGNSSVGIRECSYLGVPVVNIGSRQSGRDRGGNVIDVEHQRDLIASAINQHAMNGRYPHDELYGDGHAGVRIAESLVAAELTIEKRLSY
jgi:UDP-N-acetylglucosamine 2-epimerase